MKKFLGVVLAVALLLAVSLAVRAESEMIFCTKEYAPVCGVNGQTFGNDCTAEAAGVEIAHDGVCVAVCTMEWAPVCGVNGQTFGNECAAEAAGVALWYEGECVQPEPAVVQKLEKIWRGVEQKFVVMGPEKSEKMRAALRVAIRARIENSSEMDQVLRGIFGWVLQKI